MRRGARALLAAAGLVAALLAGGRAEAHAELVAAEPPAGSVVAVAPAAATLAFSEPVTALAARWFRAGAPPVDAAPRPEGARLVVPLPPGPIAGTLLLSWRVVSADGHPIGGSLAFSIGAPSTLPVAAPATTTAWPAALAHGALTVALAFGVGGAVFLRLVDAGPPLRGARRLALAAAAATLPLAALACGLHGLDLTGAPAAALLGAAPWRAALASRFAATALACVLAAALALLALLARRRERAAGAGLALAAWATAAASFALFGHAASAPPRWLTPPAVAIHAAAFLYWIGALPGLAGGVRAPRTALTLRLRRFSALAVPLVALLVASGAGLAAVQLGSAAALIDTAYGRLLLAKLAAVALLLALAAHNRLRLTPAIAAGDPDAPARLRRSVLAEIATGLLILALAGGFRLLPPPRSAAAAPTAVHAHLHGAELMAEVTLRPGRAGANEVAIALASPSGALDPRAVRIAFAEPAAGVEPVRLEAGGSGAAWRAGPLLLPHAAEWTVTVDVLVDDFTQQSLHGAIDIGQPPGGGE
ncbi:CopD family protein [Amaricoccus sp.]|uniref:copper resistance CopC/CopD family protein n=1 Tax=Amaricoccus sp. TaxID=1872485 RepID=UPI001B4FE08D|nr:CopD family protein [Amaricoccus sp.]MBP7000750.1 CopD family protein [Amaricoccus sp.]